MAKKNNSHSNRSNSRAKSNSRKNGMEKEKIGTKTRVIGIVSGKGGVGKTTFSANIGIALNALGFKTLVVDCNVTTPHLSYYLGVKNYSVTINNVFSGDIDAIFAPLDKDGVMFIPASERFEDLKNVDMKDLKNIIKRIASTERFDFIILDSAPGLGREAIGALHACDEIIFVTKPTAPNIMDVARCDEVAHMLGHRHFYMVFNMVRGKDYELEPEKAEEIFGMPVIGSIPFDENIMDSTAQGVPVMWFKPDAPSCDCFMEVAAKIAGVSLDEEVKEKYEEKPGEAYEQREDDEQIKFLSGGERLDRTSNKISFRDEDSLERLGSLEPIIDTIDAGYGYVERRTRRGFRSRLRHKIDGMASRFARKIKSRFR